MDAPEIIAFLGAILTVLSILNLIILFKDRAGKPHKENEMRIAALEEDVKNIKTDLKNDNKRIEELDGDTKIIMRYINALLGHGIDGNNEQEMIDARKELTSHLIEK